MADIRRTARSLWNLVLADPVSFLFCLRLSQLRAIIWKPAGLERKVEGQAQPSVKPRLASIKARNCSSVRARDGSRSKRSQRASSSFFSATLTGSFWSSQSSAEFMSRVSNSAAQIQDQLPFQAHRACVMQPRVRRTLGIESSRVFISPNPNGVPSGSTVIESRASKVAISLREMSWTHDKLTGSRTSSVVPAGESHSRISPERDGYFASADRRGHAFNQTVDTRKRRRAGALQDAAAFIHPSPSLMS